MVVRVGKQDDTAGCAVPLRLDVLDVSGASAIGDSVAMDHVGSADFVPSEVPACRGGGDGNGASDLRLGRASHIHWSHIERAAAQTGPTVGACVNCTDWAHVFHPSTLMDGQVNLHQYRFGLAPNSDEHKRI